MPMDANRLPDPLIWIRCTDDEIVAAWIDFESRPHGLHEDWIRDRAWWAVEAMMDLQLHDPIRALEVAFQIARATDAPKVLEMLGSGPLEDLLSDDPTLVDAVAIETLSSPNLRTALCSTWQNSMPDDVWRAVQGLAAP
jgi:hypothetical protein